MRSRKAFSKSRMSDFTVRICASGFIPKGTKEASQSSASLMIRTRRPARSSKLSLMVLKPIDMLSRISDFISS
ncbi:hypothetical protein D3C80_2032810 [compost metagenome]